MPGAYPSATLPQRAYFEQPCQKVHSEKVHEELFEKQRRSFVSSHSRVVAGSRVKAADLQAMFPSLDPSLVQAIIDDSVSPQHAVETLLMLSAASAEPASEEAGCQDLHMPKDLGVDDHMAFPVLVDTAGWQVMGPSFSHGSEDLGSAWCDLAKVAAALPHQKLAARPATQLTAIRPQRHPNASEHDDVSAVAQPEMETDYELRQRVGERRVKNFRQYGGRGHKGRRAQDVGALCDVGDSSSEAPESD